MAAPPKDLPPKYLALAEANGVEIHTQIELQRATGVSTSTLTDFLAGRRNAKPATYQAIARALKVTVAELREVRDGVPRELGPFELPAEAHLLNKRQRTAVLSIIHELANAQRRPQATRPAGELGKVRALRPEDQWQHEHDLAALHHPDAPDADLQGLDDGEE
ncbi:hypothetical protein TSOC111612_01565 [Tsukamurella ocularis]|uniref:helix-turn-helix domain-containing protein n=1 Tax=Tsukamurella ocularis TaxID=1970234 RepID=UPI0039EEBC93